MRHCRARASPLAARFPASCAALLCLQQDAFRTSAPQDHGTIGQLFVQAVTTGVGLKRVARRVGEAQIERRGVSPATWLGLFGRAVNMGAAKPEGLDLGMPDEKLPWYWLVAVEQLLIQGLPPG